MKKKKVLSIILTIVVIIVILAIIPELAGSFIGTVLGSIEKITHSFIIAIILTLIIFGGCIYLIYFIINKLLNLKNKGVWFYGFN